MSKRDRRSWGFASLLWCWACVFVIAGLCLHCGAQSAAALSDARRLESLGGEVTYAHETYGKHADPLSYRAIRYLTHFMGFRVPSSVHQAHFRGRRLNDAALAQLATVDSLRVLSCQCDVETGRGLQNLSNLRNLRFLELAAPSASLDDLRPLRGLPNLQTLILDECQLTPADCDEVSRWFERTSIRRRSDAPRQPLGAV
jgi:hypothetical protein